MDKLLTKGVASITWANGGEAEDPTQRDDFLLSPSRLSAVASGFLYIENGTYFKLTMRLSLPGRHSYSQNLNTFFEMDAEESIPIDDAKSPGTTRND